MKRIKKFLLMAFVGLLTMIVGAGNVLGGFSVEQNTAKADGSKQTLAYEQVAPKQLQSVEVPMEEV